MAVLRVGIVVWPTAPFRETAAIWQQIEACGFDHAWVYDHLIWRGVQPWYDGYATLAAVAAVTSRIAIGPLVTTPNFRHPVPSAKMLLAIDDIAGGRLRVGLGAGSVNDDAGALGDGPWTARERADRFVEWVTLLDLLLRQSVTSHRGRYYAAENAAVGGREPRLPFAIAATGRKGLAAVAAHAQTWIAQDKPGIHGDGHDMICRQLEQLEGACADAERDPRSLGRLLLTGNGDTQPLASIDAFERCAERYAALGFTDLVLHWPGRDGSDQGALRVLEQIARRR